MSHIDSRFRNIVYVLVATVALFACSNQMEPAKKALDGIEAAIAAAGPDAQQYIPDQLKAVTDQLAGLKAKFDQKDYAGVIAGAPAVLASAQGLVAAKDAAMKELADKKAAAEAALKESWTSLSGAVPAAITAVESRLSMLAKSKKLPANVTKDALAAAQTSVASAKSLWDQASASQTAGNLTDAVNSAQQAKQQIDAALAGLGMSGG